MGNAKCIFSYSTNGINFTTMGNEFGVTKGICIGQPLAYLLLVKVLLTKEVMPMWIGLEYATNHVHK